MIRYYDSEDRHIQSEHVDGCRQEAIERAHERMAKDIQGYIKSVKVLYVVYDSRYNAHTPRERKPYRTDTGGFSCSTGEQR
jgi:hypothetical protein